MEILPYVFFINHSAIGGTNHFFAILHFVALRVIDGAEEKQMQNWMHNIKIYLYLWSIDRHINSLVVKRCGVAFACVNFKRRERKNELSIWLTEQIDVTGFDKVSFFFFQIYEGKNNLRRIKMRKRRTKKILFWNACKWVDWLIALRQKLNREEKKKRIRRCDR